VKRKSRRKKNRRCK